MSEYDTRSTKGQNPNPAAHAPGKSVLILAIQLLNVNDPDCINDVAKKTQVKDGPKSICPNAAFCRVETRDVPGKTRKMVSYQA
mmetsp:Transcript_34947/g.64369  ORF Transcript_34947/g.64369 Transcript_34947/m.64369 type:complete len:84 (-) Transcript_34947:262-513(-)